MVSKLSDAISKNNYIDFSKCEVLNSDGDFSVRETFGYGGITKSNKGDPELIFKITFTEKISLTGIMIEALDSECVPKTIKLYPNNSNIDFSDIDTIKATEELTVTSGKIMKLKLAKYRNIDCLSIFMSNEDADLLKIYNIQVYGAFGENTDMSQVKNTNP